MLFAHWYSTEFKSKSLVAQLAAIFSVHATRQSMGSEAPCMYVQETRDC